MPEERVVGQDLLGHLLGLAHVEVLAGLDAELELLAAHRGPPALTPDVGHRGRVARPVGIGGGPARCRPRSRAH